jgi:hypothetical protein
MSELEAVLLVALKVVFVYGAMQEDEVLFPLRRLLEKIVALFPAKYQFYLRKPLFGCMFCMSSVWGITFTFLSLPLWIDIVLSVAGVNYLISALVGYLHKAKNTAEEKITTEIKGFKNHD